MRCNVYIDRRSILFIYIPSAYALIWEGEGKLRETTFFEKKNFELGSISEFYYSFNLSAHFKRKTTQYCIYRTRVPPATIIIITTTKTQHTKKIYYM